MLLYARDLAQGCGLNGYPSQKGTIIMTGAYRTAVVPGRTLLIAAALLLLAGCAAVPPVVSKLSLVASGISYLATSKSPSDHAVSLVMKQDCSVMRMLFMQPICQPVSETTNQALWVKVMHRKDEEEYAEVPPPPVLLVGEDRIVAR